jgi:hypothetical protein
MTYVLIALLLGATLGAGYFWCLSIINREDEKRRTPEYRAARKAMLGIDD